MAAWGNPKEQERRRRIRLSVAAWAYEKHDESFMSDAEFDKLCLEIDPKITTGNRKLDKFFREVFDPNTGQWVHKHPDKAGLERLWQTFYRPA